jgi:gluconate kinase
MGAKMLESQLATLEDPRHEAGVTSVAIDQREEDVARDASANLRRLVKEVVVPVD